MEKEKTVSEHLSPPPKGLVWLWNFWMAIYPTWKWHRYTTLYEHWQRGQFPLLCVYVFLHLGDPKCDIPPHWHYISAGLSDLHGDGKFHKVSGNHTRSGFGIELTFRLKKTPGEKKGPFWPVAIIQAAARVVFQTKNILSPGDVLRPTSDLGDSSWKKKHFLISEDHQLGKANTPFGSVEFLQIVSDEQVGASLEINGEPIEWMNSIEGVGGQTFIDSIMNDETIFELDSSVRGSLKPSGISGLRSRVSRSVTEICRYSKKDS